MVGFCAIIPGDIPIDNIHYRRNTKTIYLLHGYGNNSLEWLIQSDIYNLSSEYNMAIILPEGENSFYLNRKGTGNLYGRYIGEELVEYTRKLFGLSGK